MGLFDQLSDVVGSAVGGSSKNEHLMQAVVEMVQQNGGLPALLSQFQQGGLANLVSSWVGTGANSALSANQLQNALTGDQISQLAQKTNLQDPELLGQLSSMLPQMVDKLTPNGDVDAGNDLLQQGIGVLSKLF